jgi:hypothetical protein
MLDLDGIKNNAIGVVIAEKIGNSMYFIEILRQQGLFANEILLKDLGKIEILPPLLILYGNFTIKKEIKVKIESHIEKGNGLIVLGLIQGISQLLGIAYRMANYFPFSIGGIKNCSLGEGYFSTIDDNLYQIIQKRNFPVHGFGCIPIQVNSNNISIAGFYRVETPSIPVEKKNEITFEDEAEDEWPAITINPFGKGYVLYWAVSLVETVRRIQEGNYVCNDGIPPADGMSPIDDGILKCEDGLVLDWNHDRRIISPSAQVPAFINPIVDVWKRTFRRYIIYIADMCNVPLLRVNFWPNSYDFIMHISHDTDGNNEEEAKLMLEKVNSLGIHTTWCLITPGYSPDLCKSIIESGHELAFHFDAQSYPFPDVFSLDTLEEQLEEVYEITGLPQFYSNKNHYTRWEGKIQFFEWLVKKGIKMDQSKGPSKCGTQGFPFGTCHPWQAVDKYGELIDCLELSFQSQDIGLQGPPDTAAEIVDACKEVHGVCHFIFHPAHVSKEKVQQSFKDLVAMAKSKGGHFMRSDEIGKWYFKRRLFIESFGVEPLKDVVIEKRNCTKRIWEKID